MRHWRFWRALASDRLPLNVTGWAGDFLPVIFQQVLEIGHVPFVRSRRPRAFKASRRGVVAFAGRMAVDPAKAHILDRRAFGLNADQFFRTGAMAFTERVAASDQSHGLFVIHRHAGEGDTNIMRLRDRIRHGVRAFRINIDQAHHHRAKRRVELVCVRIWRFVIALTGITAFLIARGLQPIGFRAPVNVFFWLKPVGAPAREAERLQATGLHADIGGKDHQVGPGDFIAILLLDRPKQTASFVQVAIVWPAVQRGKTLRAGIGAAAAIIGAVGASAVPGHAHEKTGIIAIIGWPPVLAICDQRGQIFFQSVIIERLKLFDIIEIIFERADLRRVLIENFQIELLWPPAFIGQIAGFKSAAHRAFHIISHGISCHVLNRSYD